MAVLAWIRRALRETASRNRVGEWDFDALFNRELYPAVGKIYDSLNEVAKLAPVYLTASGEIKTTYWHKNVLVQSASDTTLTLTEDVSEQLPVGAFMVIGQTGAGTVTLVAGGSVVINSLSGLSTVGQWSELFLVKIDALTWVLFGGGGGLRPEDGSYIRIHEPTPTTLAHYEMQDSTEAQVLVDSVGGFDITQDQNGNPFPGVSDYTIAKVGGISMAFLPRCRHSVIDSALWLQGAMTVVMLATRVNNSSGFNASGTINYGGLGLNIQYAFETGVTGPPGTLRYWHHTGAGVVQEHIIRYFPTHEINWLAFTRSAGGVVQIWMNGKKVGSPSAALTLPTGGANGRFHFVNSAGGLTLAIGFMASVRIDNAVLSDETLVSDYNHTLGNLYGFVT